MQTLTAYFIYQTAQISLDVMSPFKVKKPPPQNVSAPRSSQQTRPSPTIIRAKETQQSTRTDRLIETITKAVNEAIGAAHIELQEEGTLSETSIASINKANIDLALAVSIAEKTWDDGCRKKIYEIMEGINGQIRGIARELGPTYQTETLNVHEVPLDYLRMRYAGFDKAYDLRLWIESLEHLLDTRLEYILAGRHNKIPERVPGVLKTLLQLQPLKIFNPLSSDDWHMLATAIAGTRKYSQETIEKWLDAKLPEDQQREMTDYVTQRLPAQDAEMIRDGTLPPQMRKFFKGYQSFCGNHGIKPGSAALFDLLPQIKRESASSGGAQVKTYEGAGDESHESEQPQQLQQPPQPPPAPKIITKAGS